MTPIYIDLHIHTSEDPNSLNKSYDIELLDKNIKKYSKSTDCLISLTDHNEPVDFYLGFSFDGLRGFDVNKMQQ